jgi:hypothetical protein
VFDSLPFKKIRIKMLEEGINIVSGIHNQLIINEGESSYHFLFEENPSLLYIINYERRIQDVNKKTCSVTGFSKKKLWEGILLIFCILQVLILSVM